jgi:FkbM family methyltransferase
MVIEHYDAVDSVWSELMSQILKKFFLFAGFVLLFSQAYCEDPKNRDSGDDKIEVSIEDVPEASPIYGEVSPVIGWNRYSGDSARSIRGWFRWWSYLRMKEPFIIDWFYGLKLKIHPGNEVCRAIFVRGIYDPNSVVVANYMLTTGCVFVDVGANMGDFSLLASQAVGKSGRIYAIEPSSRDFDRLVENVRINSLQDVIVPRKLALLDRSGVVKLSIACEERSYINTVGGEFAFKGVEKINTEEVVAQTIDEFVENEDIDKIDVLKIDIEGGEFRALKGAKNTIGKHRPSIMLGLNREALKSCGATVKELQEVLDGFNYRIYRIVEEPSFALELVTDVSKIHEKVVFCFPADRDPPILPQPEELSIADKVMNFFLR